MSPFLGRISSLFRSWFTYVLVEIEICVLVVILTFFVWAPHICWRYVENVSVMFGRTWTASNNSLCNWQKNVNVHTTIKQFQNIMECSNLFPQWQTSSYVPISRHCSKYASQNLDPTYLNMARSIWMETYIFVCNCEQTCRSYHIPNHVENVDMCWVMPP